MLKTKLPETIKTIPEAKIFLATLYFNGESFHPEDSIKSIVWNISPTEPELNLLDRLMADVYNIAGNVTPKFDPCKFILELDPEYVRMSYKDELDLLNDEVN